MENFILTQDVLLAYVQADSFPEGIQPAFRKLHSLFPMNGDTNYYGISRMEDGQIIYRAAAALIGEHADPKGLATMKIRKGNYHAIMIENYMQEIPSIGIAFQQLTALPDIDPQGYCVEQYLSMSSVRCMIRIADQ